MCIRPSTLQFLEAGDCNLLITVTRLLLYQPAKSLCHNRSAFVSVLRRPKRLHGCPYCWYSSHHPNNLRDHLKKHAEKEERLFQCSQ
ncbi:hypothetical protein NPIL_363512 [Nephila pilipes]|uniref:C2H2-type domain-containing protein n=1 Tax=Nephila pilipes TaxID=299642 RepID=A0A8X6TH47_NEPPI|nr:hypothetical protein NPIL_363512 [Nephila pilipes]